MSEQPPSKELPATLPTARYDGDLWVRSTDVLLVLGHLAEQRRENVRWENAHKILLAEVERLKRPAHEREPPHCSTCGCGLAQPPGDDGPRPLWLNDRCHHEGCANPPVDGLSCAKHRGDGQQ